MTCGSLERSAGWVPCLQCCTSAFPHEARARYEHPDARQRACSTAKQHALAGSGPAGAEAGRARCAGGADRVVPGSAAGERSDGIDLSARSGAGRALGEPEQEPQGRCAQGSGGEAGLGRERQIAGGSARGSADDERASRLDPEARRGVPCAGAGRHGRRAADAREGLRQEEARDDQGAGREREAGAEPAGHLDRTRRA